MTIYVTDTLTATAAPVVADPSPTRSWQWQRNGNPISGATASSYQLLEADQGANIAATQIESNMLGTASATSTSLGPILPFNPAALFRSNTPGVWYEPSDLTRYMSDLGPELVTNGGPDFTSTAGWTGYSSSGAAASLSIVSGWLRVTANGTSGGWGSTIITYPAKWVAVTVQWRTYGGASAARLTTFSPGVDTELNGTSGTSTIYFAKTGGSGEVRLHCKDATGWVEYRVISVREVTSISTATLFQDSAGTTPVTAVEQPVGLMLDKSKGLVLGSDVVVNGSFDTDTVWSKGTGWTIAGGAAVGVNAGNMAQTGILTIGKWYRADVTVSVYTSGTLVCGTISNQKTLPSGTGVKTVYFLADATTFYFVGGSSFNGSVDVVTVRELPGNHAFQTTSTKRPVLSARVNLLTKTEQFDDAYWDKSATTVTANATAAPDGTATADKIVDNSTNTVHGVYKDTVAFLSGTAYVLSIFAKADQSGWFLLGSNAAGAPGAYFDVANGVIGTAAGGATALIQSIGNGWYRCSIAFTAPSTSLRVAAFTADTNGTVVYSGSGARSVYIWGADLRVANTGTTLPTYQRVNTSTDYDTTGFPLYLKADGVDDAMETAAINFSGTDKVSVFAGVRKLSDAARGMVAELGAGVLNAFGIGAPGYLLKQYDFYCQGGGAAGNASINTGYAAPITNVLTGLGNISGDSAILRANGTQVAADTTTDQGTGNFGTYPLYLFSRAGTSLPFSGHMYSLIISGALTSAGATPIVEKYVASKTGITL